MLGHKAYGAIPHLPGSRTGPADRTISAGQARICLSRVRDRHDAIIVTEKLDGSCVAVARIGDDIVALGREGRRAADSPNPARQMFAAWASARTGQFRAALAPDERLCGEWLALAHSTRYAIAGDPFVAFDVMVGRSRRLPYDDLIDRAARAKVATAGLISRGPPLGIADAMARLGERGLHGAIDGPEGAVWRVERRGVVELVAKYVRPDKVDGALLPENTGAAAVWNWRPADATLEER